MKEKNINILAVDTGLTGCKALVFDREGNVLAEAERETPVETGPHGCSVIDMEQLWKTACKVIAEAAAACAGRGAIGCVGFSGHGNGLYCVDASGRPSGKAITSMDMRSAGELATLQPESAEWLKQQTTQQLWPGQPGAILRWLKRQYPEQYRRIHKVMFCKDYLAFRLTGEVATDFSDISASGLMDNVNGGYHAGILAHLDIGEAMGMLPPVIRGYDFRGGVSAQGSMDTGLAKGIPVIGGMFDVDACVYGCGTFLPGGSCSIAGTWNINTAVADGMRYSPRIRQCARRTDGQSALLIDSSATSATNIKWFVDAVLEEADYEQFDARMENYIYASDSPFFLPFIKGTLLPDGPGGAFTGLDVSCGQEKMFAAVYEGIGFAHRWHLENLELAGAQIDTVRVTGGAARGRHFRRLLADICGKSFEAVNVEQSGALGVWAAACAATGISDSMEAAIGGRVKVIDKALADKPRNQIFNQRYMKFKELLKCHL